MEPENVTRFLWRENGVIDPMRYMGDRDFYGKFLIVGEDRPKFFIAVGGKKGDVSDHLNVRDEMQQGRLRSGGSIDIFPSYGVVVFYGKVGNMNLSFARKDVIWVAKSMAREWGLQKAVIFGADIPEWADEKSMNPLEKCIIENYLDPITVNTKTNSPFYPHDEMFYYIPFMEYAIVELCKLT